METDVNHLVFKLINSLLNRVDALPANFEFDAKDVYSPEKYKIGPVGSYVINFTDDNNKRVKLTIIGVRHDDSISISEIEKYTIDDNSLISYMREELYSIVLLDLLIKMDDLLNVRLGQE